MFLKLLLLSDEFSFNYEGLSTSPSRIASGIRLIGSCSPPPGVSESATSDSIQWKMENLLDVLLPFIMCLVVISALSLYII